MQTMPDEQLIGLVKKTMPNLIALYRFGSQATGEARPESDVDLAILASEPCAPRRLVEVREELAAALHRDVDLVDLRTASTVLRMQVLAQGECLASADDLARERFEDMVYTSYARLNEERRGILDDIRARGVVYAG